MRRLPSLLMENLYRSILSDWLWPILENIDIRNVWLKRDGLTCDSYLETVPLTFVLQKEILDHVISQHADRGREWPAISGYLTNPMRFLLMGFCYQKCLRTIPKQAWVEGRALNKIQLDFCERFMDYFRDCIIRYRRAMRGYKLDINFYT